jgi:hypothetical protein
VKHRNSVDNSQLISRKKTAVQRRISAPLPINPIKTVPEKTLLKTFTIV